jgi:hypothetical protein
MKRIDIFSQKGGVGKTSLAILMAKHFVSSSHVLIVDADLTGSCLGDAIAPHVVKPWEEIDGLSQLICDAPETLVDAVKSPPVYRFDPRRLTEDATKLRIQTAPEENSIVFCPSHLYADDHKHANVLRALAAHESSGNWVRHVIQSVINATIKILGDNLVVIVDHSPGMAALQQACIDEIRANAIQHAKDEITTPNDRVALMVTSADMADINICVNFLEKENKELENNKKEQDSFPVRKYMRAVANNILGEHPKDLKKLDPYFVVARDESIAYANKSGVLAGQNNARETLVSIGEICRWVVNPSRTASLVPAPKSKRAPTPSATKKRK